MIQRYKQHSIIGLSLGIALAVGALFLVQFQMVSGDVAFLIFLLGIGIYMWGCAALAKAKGYSSAIVLTVILGLLFPMIVLLALRDKNRHRRSSD